MSTPLANRLTGVTVIGWDILIVVPVVVLGAAIEWPASLDDPAEVALPRLLANEGAVRFGYIAYLAYSVLFLPVAVAVHPVRNPQRLRRSDRRDTRRQPLRRPLARIHRWRRKPAEPKMRHDLRRDCDTTRRPPTHRAARDRRGPSDLRRVCKPHRLDLRNWIRHRSRTSGQPGQ